MAQPMGFVTDIRASRAPAMAFVAMGMVWAGFAAQVPVIKAQIGASDAAFGLSFLVSSIGALAAMWLAPRVDRRFGAYSVIAATLAMALGFVVPAVAAGLVVFTIAMLFVAAASGVSDVLMNARISEIESATRRPLMNLNHAIFSFAYAAMAVVTGWLREAGFGPLAIALLMLAVIMGLCVFMRCPHRGSVGEARSEAAGKSGQALVWMGGIVVLAAFFSEQAVEGWSALHLERTLGGDASEGALGPAILGLTMGFGRLFGQTIAARVPDAVMIGVACLISALGLALAAFAPTLSLAYLGFGVMGAGISVVVPLSMALVGRSVPQADRVSAIGRASVIGYGAFLVGPAIMGITSDLFGLPAAFLLVAAVLVAVAVLLAPAMALRLRLIERL